MNPEQPDHVQRALADLDARLGRITAEVAEVRAGLSALGRQTAGQVVPQQPVPPAGSTTVPEAAWAGGPWRPAAQAPHPDGPWRPGRQEPQWPGPPGHWQGPGSASPAAPAGPWQPGPTPDQPSRHSRLNAASVIAAIGGAVMLAGVAFLLVVAIQAGLFPPIARVIGAAVLAVVLVGLGLRLQSRHEATEAKTGDEAARAVNPGALALVGTGLAAGMLDVIASAVLYQWVPVPAAYLFVGGLALAGMVLAGRWASAVLAGLVAAGTMALAPLISTGIELPIFYVIVGIATAVLAAELGVVVRLVWSVPPAFMLTGYLASAGTTGRVDLIALIAAALVFAAVAASVAWYDTFRREPAAEYAALVVVPSAVPLLALPTLDLLQPGWPVGLLLAAAYLATAVLVGRSAVGGGDPDASRATRAGDADAGDARAEVTRGVPHDPHHDERTEMRRGSGLLLAAVTGSVGSVLLVAAWGELNGRGPSGLALTLTAIAYALAAGQWPRRWLDWAAGIIAGLALVTYLGVNQPQLALSERLAVRDFSYIDVVASFALAVLAVAVTWWAGRRRPGGASRIVMAGVVVALAALSVMVVAAGVVIGDLVGYARNGFLVAHLAVTVVWICCAAWLVLAGSSRLADARKLGFVLGGLALAKLLFLDLATLPGLFRVLSFIVVGAVMLAVAVRYRGGPDQDRASGPGPDGAGVPGVPGADYRRDTEPSGNGSPT